MSITVSSSAVCVALLVIGVQLLLAHATTVQTIHLLQARVDAAASSIRIVNGQVTVSDGPADSLDQNLWIFSLDGARVDGAVPPLNLRPTVRALSSTQRAATLAIAGVRLYARPILDQRSGRVLAVAVTGLDLTPYESAERHGLVLSVALGAMIVLAAGLAAWTSVGASLRHVRQMIRRADDWREHDLTGRFDLGEPVDELTALGRTLDQMLDRITSALQAERRLTDEVAHELRTPLSVIRSEAQLALSGRPVNEDVGRGQDSVARATDDALRAILAATAQMDQAIRTMLDLARSVHREEGERCGVSDILAEVRLRAPVSTRVTLSTQRSQTRLQAAAPLAVVMGTLAPILDNAVHHARSQVSVTARALDDRILIEVHDDGPGVDDEHQELIFRPGHSSTSEGAGLGLALSRRLAHSIGAEVRERGNGHGLFVLDLPAAD